MSGFSENGNAFGCHLSEPATDRHKVALIVCVLIFDEPRSQRGDEGNVASHHAEIAFDSGSDNGSGWLLDYGTVGGDDGKLDRFSHSGTVPEYTESGFREPAASRYTGCMRTVAALGIVGLLLVSGCGGGGGGTASGPLEKVGAGSVEATGTNLLLDVQAPGATLYALTGNISGAIYNDLSPTLDETEIYYCSKDDIFGNWRLQAISPGDGSVRFIADLVGSPREMRVDPAGNYVYLILQTTSQRLYRYPTAGGPRQLISSSCSSFALTPSGHKVVFIKAGTNDGIWKMNPDGTGVALAHNATIYTTIWGCTSDDSVRVYDSVVQVSDIKLTGVGLTPQDNTNGFGSVSMSQDGTAEWGFVLDGTWHLFRSAGRFVDASSSTVYTTTPYASSHIDIGSSPDATKAVVSTSSTGTAVGRITDGTSNTIILEEQALAQVAWGPFVRSRIFAGAGPFVSGAGAVVFSEYGEVLPAVVLADAVTRSSVVVTKVSTDGSKNTVYRLNCDNLSKLYYAVNPAYRYQAIVTSATGLKGAFISFASDTGKLVSVVTFSGTVNAAATSDGVVIEGDLTEHFGGAKQTNSVKL